MEDNKRVVLAPTDMSAFSLAAVSHGAALAQDAGARLILFSVITPREAEDGVAEAVLRHAPCPVITVRGPASREPSVSRHRGRALAFAAKQAETHPH